MQRNLGALSGYRETITNAALTVDGREVVSNSPDDLREMIRAGRRNAVNMSVVATAPTTGTHFSVSCQVAGSRWAAPGHFLRYQQPAPGIRLQSEHPPAASPHSPGAWKPLPACATCWNKATSPSPLRTATG